MTRNCFERTSVRAKARKDIDRTRKDEEARISRRSGLGEKLQKRRVFAKNMELWLLETET